MPSSVRLQQSFFFIVSPSVVLGPTASETLRLHVIVPILSPSQSIQNHSVVGSKYLFFYNTEKQRTKQVPLVIDSQAYWSLHAKLSYPLHASQFSPANLPPTSELSFPVSYILLVHFILNFLLSRPCTFSTLKYLPLNILYLLN